MASQEGNGSAFQVVGFDLGEHYEQLAMQTPFRMAFTIEENYYNGYNVHSSFARKTLSLISIGNYGQRILLRNANPHGG